MACSVMQTTIRSESGDCFIAGVDEAGRGPLAGPVAAAAVILSPDVSIADLRDSKQLSATRREFLAAEIRATALAWAVGWADTAEIDYMNILQASLLAMRRAVLALNVEPDHVLVDGNQCPLLPCRAEAIVQGDRSVAVISAASILAKVERDALMRRCDQEFPGYGFGVHKGYPTQAHLQALEIHGICAIHRRSFAPVRRFLES